MAISVEHVLVDAGAALAPVQRENPSHRAARLRDCRRGLSGHAAVLGLAGGAFHVGLVAVAAREHRPPPIFRHRRAERTYRALGVTCELLRPRLA